jgi:hypothetical protein
MQYNYANFHGCVHIVRFSVFTTQCSFIITHNPTFMLLPSLDFFFQAAFPRPPPFATSLRQWSGSWANLSPCTAYPQWDGDPNMPMVVDEHTGLQD